MFSVRYPKRRRGKPYTKPPPLIIFPVADVMAICPRSWQTSRRGRKIGAFRCGSRLQQILAHALPKKAPRRRGEGVMRVPPSSGSAASMQDLSWSDRGPLRVTLTTELRYLIDVLGDTLQGHAISKELTQVRRQGAPRINFGCGPPRPRSSMSVHARCCAKTGCSVKTPAVIVRRCSAQPGKAVSLDFWKRRGRPSRPFNKVRKRQQDVPELQGVFAQLIHSQGRLELNGNVRHR